MISIEVALFLDRRMRALTGWDGRAFLPLERRFAGVLWAPGSQQRRAGQPRQRAVGGGRTGRLPDARRKLFFILFYLKAYPTQDGMGYFFGLSQPQVCAWVGQWLPLWPTLRAVERPARQGPLPVRRVRAPARNQRGVPGWHPTPPGPAPAPRPAGSP